MSSIICRPFLLSPRHFYEGLTSPDFSDYLGFYTPVFTLSDFPHWEKLSKENKLSVLQSTERSEAIWDAAIRCYEKNLRGYSLTREGCLWLAMQTFASVSSSRLVPLNLNDYPLSDHFRSIQIEGLSALDKSWVYREHQRGKERYVVYPEPLENIKADEFAVYESSVALLNSVNEDEVDLWCRQTRLPRNQLERFPRGGWARLATDLHEMRHLMHVFPQARMPIHNFYCELDADLFSRYTIGRHGNAEEYLQANLNNRYLEFLCAPEHYWIAPVMEAIEKGWALPSYKEVIEAGYKFRQLLSKEMRGDTKDNEPQKIDIVTLLSTDSHAVYDAVCNISRKEDLSEMKLVRRIAECIRISMQYFCPQIAKPALRRLHLNSVSGAKI